MEQPMSAIRIRKHLDSDTLHLPELRNLIGHDVEITVVEQSTLTQEQGRKFWQNRSLDELAAEQSYVPRTFDQLQGPFSSDEFEGFDEFLEMIRQCTPPRENA
jgi:hypothetical protein